MTGPRILRRPVGETDLRTSLLLIFLVSISPFLRFYAHNLAEGLPARDLAPYFIVTVTLAVLVYLGLRRLLQPTTQRAANAVAVFVIVWFNYESTSDFMSGMGMGFGELDQLAAWLALLCVALGAVALLGSHPTFHHFLLLFALVSLTPPLFTIMSHHLAARGTLSATEAYPLSGNGIWSGSPTRRPDIYWLVLDSYPNEGHLRDQYGLDNSGFVGDLRELGFYVATDSYSNYSWSVHSITSTLNMEYIRESEDAHSGTSDTPWSWRDSEAPFYDGVAGNNRTVSYLRQLGYLYVHYDNGWFQMSRCRGFEDVCLRAHSPTFSELQSQLLRLVPYRALARFLPLPALMTRARRRRSTSGTGIPEFSDAVTELTMAKDRPLFAYAHFAPPHSPYVNEPDCTLRSLPQDQFSEDAQRLFTEQVECVNRQLVELLRRLVSAEPSSIIIVSGDHGPRLEPLEDPDSEAGYRDYLAILNALRLPPDCREGLSPGLTAVNTMRILFACLGEDPVRLLDTRHFIERNPEDGGRALERVELP